MLERPRCPVGRGAAPGLRPGGRAAGPGSWRLAPAALPALRRAARAAADGGTELGPRPRLHQPHRTGSSRRSHAAGTAVRIVASGALADPARAAGPGRRSARSLPRCHWPSSGRRSRRHAPEPLRALRAGAVAGSRPGGSGRVQPPWPGRLPGAAQRQTAEVVDKLDDLLAHPLFRQVGRLTRRAAGQHGAPGPRGVPPGQRGRSSRRVDPGARARGGAVPGVPRSIAVLYEQWTFVRLAQAVRGLWDDGPLAAVRGGRQRHVARLRTGRRKRLRHEGGPRRRPARGGP